MAWKRSSKRMTDETDDGRKVAQNRLMVWLSRRCINAQSSEQNVGSAWWRSLSGCRAEAGSSCTRKCRFVLFQPSGYYLYPSFTLPLRVPPSSLSLFHGGIPLFWPSHSRIVVSYANVPEPVALSDYDRLNDSNESFKFVIGFHSLVSEECDWLTISLLRATTIALCKMPLTYYYRRL